MGCQLATKRIHLTDVVFSFYEFSLGFGLFEFINFKTKRVFENCTTVARGREQYPIRFALGNDVVSCLADVCACQQFFDIAKGA